MKEKEKEKKEKNKQKIHEIVHILLIGKNEKHHYNLHFEGPNICVPERFSLQARNLILTAG